MEEAKEVLQIRNNEVEVRQMQEKFDGLQQKQLQGDMARGRNAMNKSKFNKFGHVNMENVLGFCKTHL